MLWCDAKIKDTTTITNLYVQVNLIVSKYIKISIKVQNYNELLTGDNEKTIRSSRSQLPSRFLSTVFGIVFLRLMCNKLKKKNEMRILKLQISRKRIKILHTLYNQHAHTLNTTTTTITNTMLFEYTYSTLSVHYSQSLCTIISGLHFIAK